MGVLYDYFRAPGVDEVRAHMDEHGYGSTLGAFDGLAADRVPELAGRWARIEEFSGYADAGDLRGLLTELSAPAARARDRGESLVVWSCL